MLAALDLEGNYSESVGEIRAPFPRAPGAQKPGQVVGACTQSEKMGRGVVVAGCTMRENGLLGLGSKRWCFGLRGGQPRCGCGSGCRAKLVWWAGGESNTEAQEGGVRRILAGILMGATCSSGDGLPVLYPTNMTCPLWGPHPWNGDHNRTRTGESIHCTDSGKSMVQGLTQGKLN